MISLSNKVNDWIAESESWQSFIDFNIDHEFIENYRFLKRPEDFYISLMCYAFDLFKYDTEIKESTAYLVLAKGLEIFSLEGKRENFSGINYANNMLFAAGLYYLAGYSASSCLLANKFKSDNFIKPIDKFILEFFTRKLQVEENKLSELLRDYLRSGKEELLATLNRIIKINLIEASETDYDAYASFKLASVLLSRFEENNIWRVLLNQTDKSELEPEVQRQLWRRYIKVCLNKKYPIWTFFPSQSQAIHQGILGSQTFALQMPTSAGKTAISELIIYHEVKFKDNRILYLAPFRALASELKSSMCKDLAKLGVKTKSIYGGNLSTAEEKAALNDIDVLISTPEKLMAVEDIEPGILDQFDTVICDEGHLLDDSTRGLSYELLLSRLKTSPIPKRFIFISAIIPNISTINNWLGGSSETLVHSNYRPSQLEYAFLKEMEHVKAYYLDVNPSDNEPVRYQLQKYITHEDLRIKLPNLNKTQVLLNKKSISVASSLKALPQGCVALFAPHKKKGGGVEELSEEILKQLHNGLHVNKPSYYSNLNDLQNLEEYFTKVFGAEYLLCKLVKQGALFHHGDLPQFIREVVEDAIRSGAVRLIVCNTTLAEGVNLPIKTIVIHSTKRFDKDEKRLKNLNLRDLKNLVGRAGRAGKERKGLVIVPHESDQAVIKNLILEINIEPVNGRLYQIVKIIERFLIRNRLVLSNNLLDNQNEWLLKLLDSIETSLIDLLAEEVTVEELQNKVESLIKETLTYNVATDSEKVVLQDLINLRSQKLIPYIQNGTFSGLKRSGSTLRLFNEIISSFDFENEIWIEDFELPSDEWQNYLFVNGLFKLKSFEILLNEFNEKNKTKVQHGQVIDSINLWIQGYWYQEISNNVNLEVPIVINLIHNFISFNVQDYVTKTIRIKELLSNTNITSFSIINYPLYLQYGINGELEIDLFELGINDRISVLFLANYLKTNNYFHQDKRVLRQHLLRNEEQIFSDIGNNIPSISISKLKENFSFLRHRNIF